jgi:hypothetical protein
MLKWEKLGERTWYGEDGWLRYHIERTPAGLHRTARGGITSTDWFGEKWKTLKSAKLSAQRDARKREDKVQSLPDYPGKMFDAGGKP